MMHMVILSLVVCHKITWLQPMILLQLSKLNMIGNATGGIIKLMPNGQLLRRLMKKPRKLKKLVPTQVYYLRNQVLMQKQKVKIVLIKVTSLSKSKLNTKKPLRSLLKKLVSLVQTALLLIRLLVLQALILILSYLLLNQLIFVQKHKLWLNT